MNLQKVAALILGLWTATALSADAPQGDQDKFQGTWEIKSIELVGETTPAPKGSGSYTFAKDKVVMKQNEGKDVEGTFKIDASKSPRQIDLLVTMGKEKQAMEAIYEFKGDTLKIAYSIQGPKGKRPTAFDSKVALIMYLKK